MFGFKLDPIIDSINQIESDFYVWGQLDSIIDLINQIQLDFYVSGQTGPNQIQYVWIQIRFNYRFNYLDSIRFVCLGSNQIQLQIQ